MRPFALVVCAGLLAVSNVRAQDTVRAPIRKRTVAEDLLLFSQVLNQIRINHPDDLDNHDLLLAAIMGMVQAADPHSYVIPAARLDPTREGLWRSGKLYPMPILFRIVDGAPLVVQSAPGSRAKTIDIVPGDELIAVDGQPVAAESIDELELALAGPKGSSSTLSLRRRRVDGSIAQIERKVERERVEEATAVPVSMLLDAQTGYVRVTTFAGSKVADDLHAAIEQLEKKGMQRLLIDLRGNSGGRVDEAKQIAGEFLPRGTIVYTTSGKKPEVATVGRVERSFWRSERKYPVVLLVDDGTASASELVAGALQDHDRAIVVGRPTFGKALLMQTFPMADGSRFVLVIGRLSTPCGRIIQREYRGVTRRDYYREAGQLDTVGRVPCKTDAGRTVYGGGGIVPDVLLPEPKDPPLWLSEVNERGIVLAWAGAQAAKTIPPGATIESFGAAKTVTSDALADFRAFSASKGVKVTADVASDADLTRLLLRALAFARFGDMGLYWMIAVTDPAVETAVGAFDKATQLTK
jgi:carboxyl-terminal processing protease